jgi:hypothetical protein
MKIGLPKNTPKLTVIENHLAFHAHKLLYVLLLFTNTVGSDIAPVPRLRISLVKKSDLTDAPVRPYFWLGCRESDDFQRHESLGCDSQLRKDSVSGRSTRLRIGGKDVDAGSAQEDWRLSPH